MTTQARQQPVWHSPPQPKPEIQLPNLKIWNSLTRSKTAFVPLDSLGKRVTWYVCGPTVYDDAHLGHARNYVSTDIIRRIMKDYFKFDVQFVMNITDVDDKIIVRGRQQHLLEEFYDTERRREKHHSIEATCVAALKAYLAKNLPLVSSDTPAADVPKELETHYKAVLDGKALDGGVPGDKEAKIKMHIKTARTASSSIASGNESSLKDHARSQVQDILLPYLDSLYGSTIDASDHSVFTKLTNKFEDRFMEDVRALNCADPDVVTRVTEYGQQIVDFVAKVESNGFAYRTSDGSVYFDIEAFEAAKNSYARLEPWNRNDKELLADGEGALTKKTSEKRSDADFALWKSSKPGEPNWPSPWGNGRPGWHIECSAMASDKLGSQIDIHSGGIDLAFPHHDNEMAQSEAYWCQKHGQCKNQWVNYFMHMGHLSIQGSKMSKSLKNFTTIREALSRGDWTPRGLRIVFLLGGWREGIEITDEIVKEGSAWEDKVNNFFIKVNDIQDRASGEDDTQTFDKGMESSLQNARKEVHEALCDSFNTGSAMRTISELISEYNSADKSSINTNQTLEIARWITSIINTFGLNGPAKPDDSTIGWSGIQIPNFAKPYLTSISRTRDELRTKARSAQTSKDQITETIHQCVQPDEHEKEPSDPEAKPYQKVLTTFHRDLSTLSTSSPPDTLAKEILALCDRIRDTDLWHLGIYLEDRAPGHPALIRPVTRELRSLRASAAAEKDVKEESKRLAKEIREQEAREKMEKGRL
ncbi:MAG: hypothetical protein Q9174_004454, partial [Haloplaca sp. 1 TL-2023]